MNEYPILFAGPQVRAILEGRKTQTRRPITFDVAGPVPYGFFGDHLWVRESWQPVTDSEHRAAALYRADLIGNNHWHSPGWRPSMHMPRWACRIVLRVTSVRTELVRNISPADVIAEGFNSRQEFRHTWESRYGKGSWMHDRPVWVIGFERI